MQPIKQYTEEDNLSEPCLTLLLEMQAHKFIWEENCQAAMSQEYVLMSCAKAIYRVKGRRDSNVQFELKIY